MPSLATFKIVGIFFFYNVGDYYSEPSTSVYKFISFIRSFFPSAVLGDNFSSFSPHPNGPSMTPNANGLQKNLSTKTWADTSMAIGCRLSCS